MEKVRTNLAEAVRIKKEKSLGTTLGVQCLLLPDNKDYVVDMAKELRDRKSVV